MNSYHFSLGNSTDGAIGFCASILDRNPEHAVLELQQLIELHTSELQEVEVYGDKEQYITVYLNPGAISLEDIDFWTDPDGEHHSPDHVENKQEFLILRDIGKAMANMMERSPSSVAEDMGMPKHVVNWLEEVNAYFAVEVRTDCQ